MLSTPSVVAGGVGPGERVDDGKRNSNSKSDQRQINCEKKVKEGKKGGKIQKKGEVAPRCGLRLLLREEEETEEEGGALKNTDWDSMLHNTDRHVISHHFFCCRI